LYKAKYPFGTKIAHQRQLYLPTTDGNVEAIKTSNNIPNKIKDSLRRRKMPAALMLNNNAEMYYEMPDRVISGFVMSPGKFLWLWEQFDRQETDIVAWAWSLAAGARSIYSLPKISDIQGHKRLQKEYKIKSQAPREFLDQWNVFVEIANSQNFKEEWHCEILFFSDIWFDTAVKDPAWQNFYNYLFGMAWDDSRYWRYTNTLGLAWGIFMHKIIKGNVKLNIYLASIVKQLILTGIGVLPCLSVANDDTFGPIEALQKVYLDDYKMRASFPIFMRPHAFSFNDTSPCYFPLQNPNLLETIPIPRSLPSVLSAMPDIQFLLNEFKTNISDAWIIEDSPLHVFCNKVQCDFFHYRAEEWNHIYSTEELPKEDPRLLQYPGSNKSSNTKRTFPSSSNLLSGCIRFSNKTKKSSKEKNTT
ncbi:MAG: hypothetical protein KAT71_03915, partial [Gammaproteobacteria bacterium]|nr:hypothetical protein [Gammaproteobacteria bacterium]